MFAYPWQWVPVSSVLKYNKNWDTTRWVLVTFLRTRLEKIGSFLKRKWLKRLWLHFNLFGIRSPRFHEKFTNCILIHRLFVKGTITRMYWNRLKIPILRANLFYNRLWKNYAINKFDIYRLVFDQTRKKFQIRKI